MSDNDTDGNKPETSAQPTDSPVVEKPGANSSLPEVDSPTTNDNTAADATTPAAVEEKVDNVNVTKETELNSSLPDVTTPTDVTLDEKSEHTKNDGVASADAENKKESVPNDKDVKSERASNAKPDANSNGKDDSDAKVAAKSSKEDGEVKSDEKVHNADVKATQKSSEASSASPKTDSELADEIHLIALLNRKSGGGKGLVAWEELTERQRNCTTIDILTFAKADTSEVDAKLRDLIDKHPNCRVIVGGGDGTVTWTFEILDRIKRSPPVAVLPLGTANEVSGCIGWTNSDNGRRLTKFTNKVRSGEITDIDLWQVEYDDDNTGDDKVELPPRRPETMIAFLSFGLDANIAHKFHVSREARKSQPSVLGSKMVYLKYGMEEIRSPSKKLNNVIEIKVDDEGLKRKCERSYRCLQVLNINSMADGVDFFGTAKSNKDDVIQEGDYTPPKLNDGKLELVGSKTVHQMNFLRANIGHALRLGQGKKMEFTLREPTPLEVDGEAWINPKGVVKVTHLGGRDIVIGPKLTGSTRRCIIRKNAPVRKVTSKVSVMCV